MKKTLAIILAAMLLVACFVGCASKPAESTAPETEDTTAPETEDTTAPEAEDAAPAAETGLEGHWVADGHPDYTMDIDATTMTAADGTVYDYTVAADGTITMSSEGVSTEDVITVTYDPETDVINMTAGDATVNYLRAE